VGKSYMQPPLMTIK